MRVLVVTGLSHWGAGGVERETEHLLAALVERGVETGVVMDRDVAPPGVARFPITYPPGPAAHVEIAAAERAFRPDVVHVIGGGFRTIDATRRATRLPWLVTMHNLPPRERSAPLLHGRNTLHYATRTALALPSVALWAGIFRWRACPVIIVHSSSVMRDAIRRGCPADRIQVIPLGADLDGEPVSWSREGSVFPPDASPKVATVAGLIHHKGLHDYLAVAERLRTRFPKLHYAIVGSARDNRYSRFLPDLVRKQGLTDRVTIATNASNAVRDSTVADADLYVQPSHEEGFCLTFAEGAAKVCRVLGTSTGAMPELAADDPAIRIVPPKSLRELESATVELLEHSFDRDEVLRQRRARWRTRFSWSRHADEHVSLYRRVAARSIDAA